MEIKITYVFKREDGVIGYSCGIKPDGVEILEERQILIPRIGYELQKGEERFDAVWLKDGDVKENYTEVEIIEEEEIEEEEITEEITEE